MNALRTIVVMMVAVSVVVGVADELRADSLLDGLVAHYPFSGDATDATGNGHNGVVHGATLTTDRFGNANSAYWFDGVDDYISVADADALDVNHFTASLWFNAASPSSPVAPRMLMVKSNTPLTAEVWPMNFRLYLHQDNNMLIADTFTPHRLARNIPRAYEPQTWKHVAFTYDGSRQTVYLDGMNAGSDAQSGTLNVNDYDLRFAARWWNGAISDYFDGSLDDIRLYNRAL